MVCGQQRLTFTSVQKNGVYRFRRFQFHTGRETCSTHTNDTCFADDINDLVRSQVVQIFMWLYGFVQSIFTIRFNNNSHHFAASGSMHTRFYSNYGSAYAGMYRSTDKSCCFADLLTNLYGIPNCNDRVRRSAQMLGHGNNNGLWIRELLQGNMLTEFFAF